MVAGEPSDAVEARGLDRFGEDYGRLSVAVPASTPLCQGIPDVKTR
jgi:hypothetical protein